MSIFLNSFINNMRDLCELLKYVNHKSKFTEKSCEPGSQKFGSQKFGSRTIFKFFYSNNREPNFCEPIFCEPEFCEPKFFVEKNLSYTVLTQKI